MGFRGIGTFFSLAGMILIVGSLAIAGSNQQLVYQGRIIRPDGSTVNSGTVTFSLSVYSPSPKKCLLYSETQAVNMSGSIGMFSLPLGNGTRTDGGSYSFSQIFINGSTLSGLTCADGSTSYTSAATDDRNLSVSFNDAGNIVNLSAMAIKSVPFALQAHEIDGWGLNNLVKVSALGSPTTFTPTEMVNVKTVGAAACATNEILKWNGSAWMCGTDVSAGSPADASYAAKGVFQADTDAATSGLVFSASGVLKVNAGTGANQIVKLDGSSKLPAVDGSQLTNLSATQISAGTLPISRGGTGASTKTAAFDALSPNSTKGDLIVHNGTNNVSLPLGSNGQVLTADSSQATGVKWANVSTGSVTSLTAGTGLTGGTITSTGTLGVNVGTGANQIVQLDGSSRLPAVDGSQLSNISFSQISSGTLPVPKGGTGVGSFLANKIVGTDGTGSSLTSFSCASGEVIKFNGSGAAVCGTDNGGTGSEFLNGGNSFGANATLGTNDNYTLGLKTNNTTRMTIDATGKVGIGTSTPWAKLEVSDLDTNVIARVINTDSTTTHYPAIMINNYVGAAGSGSPQFGLVNARGNLSSPSPVLTGDALGSLIFSGASDTNWNSLEGAAIRAHAAENFSNTTSGASLRFYTTAVGANLSTERMRIDPSGNLGIGTASPGSKLDLSLSSTSATAANEIGERISVTDTGVVTSGTDNTYGSQISVSRSGATGGTINTYGQYISASMPGDSGSTDNLYGNYINLAGGFLPNTLDASYGSYVYDSPADSANHYGFYANLRPAASGNTVYGFYADTSNLGASNPVDYGFYGKVGTGGGGALAKAYGLYIDGTSGTNGSAYGVYVDVTNGTRSTNYSGIFMGGNFGIGVSAPNTALDLNGALSYRGIAAPSLSPAGQGRIYFDSGTNKFRVSENGGAYADLVGGGGGSGTVTQITAGTGLTGGTITSAGTLSVNVGTGANQIVQLDASSKLPTVDGSQLSNLSATQISAGTLPTARGGTGAVTYSSNALIMTNGTGTAFTSLTCSSGEVPKWSGTAWGCQADDQFLADSNNNLKAGTNALAANTTGSYNVALGISALSSSTVGQYNVAIGREAQSNMQTAAGTNSNVSLGYQALQGSPTPANNTGTNNFAVGYQSLGLNSAGSNNFAVGIQALYNNDTGSNNFAIGPWSLNYNTIGDDNISFGWQAQFGNTSGSRNIAMGTSALANNVQSNVNIAIGHQAQMNMEPNVGDGGNIAIGRQAVMGSGTPANNTGTFNIGIGDWALQGLTTGDYNVAIGNNPLQNTTSGSTNVAIGNNPLAGTTTGASNIGVGNYALANNLTGSESIAIGSYAQYRMQAAGNADNIAIGVSALEGSPTVANNTGVQNIAIGQGVMQSISSGYSNVAMGDWSALTMTSGYNNVSLGFQAGYPLGSNGITSGDNNTFLGSNSGFGSTTQLSYATALGAGSAVTTSNTVILGRASDQVAIGQTAAQSTYKFYVKTDGTNTVVGGSVPWTNASDRRYKTNVEPIRNALDLIVHLQGVRFDWDHQKYPNQFEQGRQIGFIAQQIELFVPEIVRTDGNGYKGVQYSQLVAVLTEAVKELYAKFLEKTGLHDRQIASLEQAKEKLELENQELKSKNQELEKRLDRIEKRLGLDSK